MLPLHSALHTTTPLRLGSTDMVGERHVRTQPLHCSHHHQFSVCCQQAAQLVSVHQVPPRPLVLLASTSCQTSCLRQGISICAILVSSVEENPRRLLLHDNEFVAWPQSTVTPTHACPQVARRTAHSTVIAQSAVFTKHVDFRTVVLQFCQSRSMGCSHCNVSISRSSCSSKYAQHSLMQGQRVCVVVRRESTATGRCSVVFGLISCPAGTAHHGAPMCDDP